MKNEISHPLLSDYSAKTGQNPPPSIKPKITFHSS